MEKRVIIAFVLSFAVLYAFRAFYSPPPAPQDQQQSAQSQTAPAAPPKPQSAPPAPAVNESQTPPPAAEVHGEKAEELTIDTPLFTATLSNVGGVLRSYTLKAFKDGEGHPLELINQFGGSRVGWPLALMTEDPALTDRLNKALFVVTRDGDKATLEYDSNGLHARKVLQFDPQNYQFTYDSALTDSGRDVPYSVLWRNGFGDQSLVPQDERKQNALYQADTSFTRAALTSLKDPAETTYKCGLLSSCPTSVVSSIAGVEDQYFVATLRSLQGPAAVSFHRQQYSGADGKPVGSLVLTMAVREPGKLAVYVGPKQQEFLSKADPQLAGLVSYGTFGFIARPLLAILLWIHQYVGNFGWSIILLTVALNLVLFPLRLKQQVSMLKMQKIQPQMRRLQDQYKKLKATDPRRTEVQTQMMNLYKEHGVNPMGGCLPLLLQMPLLFGFYSALAYSIELRRAPWILWIKDLSQPDPYYVIPISMAVAMFLQQKSTPTANVDPAQARMMMIMPLVFTFMFLNYGSGLALYWLTGSIISVAQQVFINKYWSPQAEAKLRSRSREEKQGT
jgi:YidC/Oxa1 family membrane protein insertase